VIGGGEFAALVLIDAVSRMLPGVVGDWNSVVTDSFYDGILGPPQYTRPPEFQGMKVPEVLTGGNHAAIARFRRKEALRVTRARRPDLLVKLSDEDRALLRELDREEATSSGDAPESNE
jgi:tRNA (guanine37-N1)-methyltransferase